MPKAQNENFECRPYDHFSVSLATPRFNNAAVKANVCMPNKARGWVGDHCRTAGECTAGTTCLGATATKPGDDGSVMKQIAPISRQSFKHRL